MEIIPMHPIISVILPIYNVAAYFPACLDSVIHQTYTSLEIILVNDGSTDNCREICEAYAAKDSRIKVIHKPNGGLSDARNAGMSVATGDLISFVDSDDLLSADFFQKLFQAFSDHDADIAECGYIEFKLEQELEKYAKRMTGSEVEIYCTEKALYMLMKEYLKQMVWNKLYRKEVIAGLRFPVGKINEDEFWTYKVFGKAQKIVKIPDELYFYRQQESSIMGKKYSLKRLDGLQALEERIGYMKERFPELENLAVKQFCFGSIFQYQMLTEHPNLDPDWGHRKNILKKIRRYNTSAINKQWKLSEMTILHLFMTAPNLYAKLMKFYLDWRVKTISSS